MRLLLFDSNLFEAGGEERLVLEHARYLKSRGHEVLVLTVFFDSKALFEKYTDIPVVALSSSRAPKAMTVSEKIRLTLSVRSRILAWKPDLVLGQLAVDCSLLYLACFCPKIRYSTHIHGTILWFPAENTKYSFLHRKTMQALRRQCIGHSQFYPETRRMKSFSAVAKREFDALLQYLGVRKAEKIFTLSNRMAHEITQLYGKPGVVLKGAYDERIFEHVPRSSLKADLHLEQARVILNVNRLDPRKRVDLLIRAFAQQEERLRDTFLVIGGDGREAPRLKALAKELRLKRIIFLGFVPEEKLLDYYATCDLFVHPNWADYAISVYEALATGRKVLCTTEMEFDRELLPYSQIFTAPPLPEAFARALSVALEAPNARPIPVALLKKYTWAAYFSQIENHLTSAHP